MKRTMTLQTGAFGVSARGLDLACRDRGASGPGASAVRSGLAAIADPAAWIIADVPTPVPVRHRGAHG